MSKATIEFFSITQGAAFGGHGGDRRLLQLRDIFDRHEMECNLHVFGQPGVVLDKVKNVALGMLPNRHAPILRFLHPRTLYYAGRVRTAIPRRLVGPGRLFAFDTLISGFATNFQRLRSADSKIILFPQNLDSLSPLHRHPLTNVAAPLWLKHEIAAIKKAHLVCCISREEQWLLSVHGIPALYLPYYPSSDVKQSLSRIRARRQTAQDKNTVLILGSASNPPTSLGLMALKPVLHSIPKAFPGTEVAVAGFGTQKHKESLQGEGVTVHGAVPPQILEDLLVRAKCAVVSQVASSGALTRICDLLVAGVPVIANHHASRSYFSIDGIHTVERNDDIVSAVGELGSDVPAIPKPPVAQEKLLVDEILKLRN